MDRRQWLGSAAAAPLAIAVARGAEPAARVQVTALEVLRVKVNQRGGWLLPRLTTSAGLSGIGDASHGGRDEVVASLMRRLFEGLKGRSIFDVEWLRQSARSELERSGRAAAVALSGLEQCLWDLQGQALGIPTWQLFGGPLRRSVRNYANINRSTRERTPSGFAAMAAKAVGAGFDAVKLAPFDDMPPMSADPSKIEEFTRLGIDRARAVREAIGPENDLLLDVHSHMNLERGLELARRLEPLNLFWLEEVTPAKPLIHLAAINRAAKMPTAGGEMIYGVEGFFPYLAAGAVDIAMPDVKYCGGMLELKKIAAMAEGAGIPISPHGPASPVGNLAAAQVCVTMPNFQILEFSFGEVPWRAELVDPPEDITKGMLTLSDRPGFGVKLNEKTVRKYSS